MAKLNPSSVNTVRCITFCLGGNVQIPYCFLKVGRNGSFVDNGGAGGILAGIDVRSGKVNTCGYDEYNETYEIHPDTGVRFDGYQMPEWEKLKAICCKMSGMLPSVKCIGWDMAYTDDGWVVIEGNGMTQFIVPQIVYKKGIKKELLSYMDKMDLLISLPQQEFLG